MQKLIDIPTESGETEELMLPGMSSCQGCGATIAMNLALKALGKRTVVVFPACCFCVFVGGYPHSSLGVPIVHCPFEAAGAVASGVSSALDARGEKDVTVMAWAGDGGTFDIGLQSLSGSAERNENILYVCYDNEAYMNTGIQRSSATPVGAWTTTTPAGSIKEEPKKDIEEIMLAHHIPYMATASVAYPQDLYEKFKKARRITGTKFIHVLSPCPPGWRIDPSKSVEAARLATRSGLFPIYEVVRWSFDKLQGRMEEGAHYTINVQPDKNPPLREYFESQGRFKMMNDDMFQSVKDRVNRKWDDLLQKANGSEQV